MAPKKKKEESYEVEKIVDMKLEKGKKMYLVKWKGYPASQNTWEPPKNLDTVKDMVQAFEKSKTTGKRKEPEPPSKKSSPAAKKTKAEPAKPAKRSSPAAEAPAAKKQKVAAKPARSIDVMALARGLMAAITGKKPVVEKPKKAEKKAEKKAKAAKPARGKKSAGEVVEVDKILGMKPAKNGGILYQILWQDGSKSWEPEDNVMDDDLVDEFEEQAQAEAYKGDAINVGSEVEVKANADGFENSWSAAVIKKKAGAKFIVEYVHSPHHCLASPLPHHLTRVSLPHLQPACSDALLRDAARSPFCAMRPSPPRSVGSPLTHASFTGLQALSMRRGSR